MVENPITQTESLIPKSTSLSEKFKKVLAFIKENTTILVLVPTIIGGTLQLYNLYIIDPYLIRFFSLTQLINDGLWTLLIFAPLYFLVPLAILFLSPSEHQMFKGSSEDKGGIGFSNFMFLSGFVVFPYFILTNKMYWLLWLLIATGIMGAKNNIEALKVFKDNNSYKNWIFFFYMASIFSTLAFIYTLTLNNSMPKNVANLQIIEKEVTKSFPNYKHSLLYMNDKYLFSKIYCDSINEVNTKIIILKIDDLFAFEKMIESID